MCQIRFFVATSIRNMGRVYGTDRLEDVRVERERHRQSCSSVPLHNQPLTLIGFFSFHKKTRVTTLEIGFIVSGPMIYTVTNCNVVVGWIHLASH